MSLPENSSLFFGLSWKREREITGKRSTGSKRVVYSNCLWEGNSYPWKGLSQYLHFKNAEKTP